IAAAVSGCRRRPMPARRRSAGSSHLVVFPEEHADAKIDRLERLGADPLIAIGYENLDIPVRVPPMDRERFFYGIDDPIVSDLMAVIHTLFSDQVVSSVLREDLANPV